MRRNVHIWVGGVLSLLAVTATLVDPAHARPGDGKQSHEKIDRELVERAKAESETLWRRGFTLQADSIDAQMQAILDRLVASAAIHPAIDLKVHVFRSPDLNAFAMPDGSIFVFVGLLAVLDSVDELAFVLGHEAQHAIGWHAQKNIAQYKSKRVAFEIVSIATTVALASADIAGAGLIDAFSQMGLSLVAAAAITGYGKDLERESDLEGIAFMERAGYDACKSVGALSAMLAEHEDPGRVANFFWGTHPLLRNRIEYIEEGLARECAVDTSASDEYASIKWTMMKKRAHLWNLVGEPHKAIAAAEAGVGVAPDDAEIHCELGHAYRAIATRDTAVVGTDTLALAMEQYLEALDLASHDYREPLLGLSLTAEARRDTAGAITYLEQYLADDAKVPRRRAMKRKLKSLKQRFGE